MPTVQENLGAVGSRQSFQLSLGGGTHSVTKEVPLIAHSRPSSMPTASPILKDTLTRIRDLQYTTHSTNLLPGQSMGFESHSMSASASASRSLAQPTQHTVYGSRSGASHTVTSPHWVESRGLRDPPFLGNPSIKHSSGRD